MYNMYKTFHQAGFFNKNIKVYFLNKEFLKIELFVTSYWPISKAIF